MAILSADFYRILKGKLGLISLIMIIALIILGYTAFSFQQVETNLAISIVRIITGFIPIFLTNIYMIVWGDEFSQRVINNVLITKISRVKVFVVKFILAYLLTLVFVCIAYIVIISIAYILGHKVDVIDLLLRMGMQSFSYFVLTGLAALLFTWLSKPYVAVAIFISYAIVIESIASNIITAYFPKLIAVVETLPTYTLIEVINVNTLKSSFVSTTILASLGYGIVLFIISCFIFMRKEFK